jgi:cell division protein FtsB
MRPQTLERRVESLEQRVTVLEQLPARVDNLAAQISQLRDEMHAEFSEVRNQMYLLRDELLGSVKAGNAEVMAQARALYEGGTQAKLAILQGRRPSRRKRSSGE